MQEIRDRVKAKLAKPPRVRLSINLPKPADDAFQPPVKTKRANAAMNEWDAVIPWLKEKGLTVVDGDLTPIPGASRLSAEHMEAVLKTATNVLDLINTLGLSGMVLMNLLDRNKSGDLLWKVAEHACIRGASSGARAWRWVFFPENTDAKVLEEFTRTLAKQGEFDAVCDIIRGCPARQMAKLAEVMLEPVSSQNSWKEVHKAFEATDDSHPTISVRLFNNPEQFVELMRSCPDNKQDKLITACLISYPRTPAGIKALVGVTYALLIDGQFDAARLLLERKDLNCDLKGEVLKILKENIENGSLRRTIRKLKEMLSQSGLGAHEAALVAMRRKVLAGNALARQLLDLRPSSWTQPLWAAVMKQLKSDAENLRPEAIETVRANTSKLIALVNALKMKLSEDDIKKLLESADSSFGEALWEAAKAASFEGDRISFPQGTDRTIVTNLTGALTRSGYLQAANAIHRLPGSPTLVVRGARRPSK